jgi:putative ABC transport system permease protein
MRGAFWLDLRHALRILGKRPGFTTTIILTLALGIGANTAVFSTVTALLLRPHDFPELERLVLVREEAPNEAGFEGFAAGDYLDLRRAGIFESVTAARFRDSNLTGGGEARSLEGFEVSGNFFSFLGAQAEIGRPLVSDDDGEGSAPVAVLSHGLFESRFGGDPGVLGTTLTLDDRPFTIVGVMPKRFDYPLGAELWTPLVFRARDADDRAIAGLKVMGRLPPGGSLAEARARLLSLLRSLGEVHPEQATRGASLLRLREEQYQYTAPLFLTLQGAAVFVLLLTCANVGNLLLARLLARRREISIRSALGAGRARHLQLFLAESLILAAAAAALGVVGALWGVRVIRLSVPPNIALWIAGWDAIEVNRLVLAFTIAISGAVALGLSLVAALHLGAEDPARSLRDGARSSAAPEKRRVQRLFVVSEVGLAALLVVGAGLMIDGFLRLTRASASFAPEEVLTAKIVLPKSRYPEDGAVLRFHDALLADLRGRPGVVSAGLASNVPSSNEGNGRTAFVREGAPLPPPGAFPEAEVEPLTTGYLASLHLPIVAGRDVSPSDGPKAPPVALVTEALARRYFPGEDPLGKRIRLGRRPEGPMLTVVGVVSDFKQNWWDGAPVTGLFLPDGQAPSREMHLVLRASGDPLALAAPLRAAIEALDPGAPVREIQTLAASVDEAVAPLRIIGLLMLAFGVIAVVLSAIGVYGVLSQTVSERRQELGVRIALGARAFDILRLVLRDALSLAVTGLAIGLPLALVLGSMMAASLFGLVAVRPGVTAAFALFLLGVALLAGYVPARRATRVDPVVALREE